MAHATAQSPRARGDYLDAPHPCVSCRSQRTGSALVLGEVMICMPCLSFAFSEMVDTAEDHESSFSTVMNGLFAVHLERYPVDDDLS